jgi:hypothetical protein
MYGSSVVRAAVVHGLVFLSDSSSEDGNIGNPPVFTLTNGLYEENGSPYTGTKYYGLDEYGNNPVWTVVFASGVVVSATHNQ